MTERINEGISITGGSINAEQIAVGRYARAEKVINSASQVLDDRKYHDISQKLQALLEALKQNSDHLNNKDEMIETTEKVATEIIHKQPNKTIIQALINGIIDGAKLVGPVLKAANDLKDTVIQLF
jgi:hypothetical protein